MNSRDYIHEIVQLTALSQASRDVAVCLLTVGIHSQSQVTGKLATIRSETEI